MASKHIEMFYDRHPGDLESKINIWCEEHKYEPTSISVVMDSKEFVAFVVVEECNDY